MSGRLRIVTALAGLLLAPAGASRASDEGTKVFLDVCAGCHTVGRGELEGPDLAEVATWSRDDVRKAIARMEEEYVGELGDEQVAGLLDLLQDPQAARRLEQAQELAGSAWAEELAAADAEDGRRLFFGEAHLEAGGVGCYACHVVGDRGGNLAKDLTDVWGRMGPSSVLSTIDRPSFPAMKAAYAEHPLTRQETADLAVYLEQAGTGAPTAPATGAPDEAVRTLVLAAALLVAAIFVAVALVARRPSRGVRARLAYAPARK